MNMFILEKMLFIIILKIQKSKNLKQNTFPVNKKIFLNKLSKKSCYGKIFLEEYFLR